MQIVGKVSTIIYSNPDNGYTVLLIKADNEYVTAVGDGTGIELGDSVELEGDFTYHKSYGEQFAFTSLTKLLPTDLDSLAQYIAESEIKGLGKKTAEKIINMFGEEAISVIRYNPEKLLLVKGMTDDKAYALSEYINDEWEKWNLTSFLGKNGIGLKTAMKIFDELGLQALSIIKENPYALMQYITSLDFKTVDSLGKNLSVNKDHPDRVGAGIIYLLNYFVREGNTCVEAELFISYALKMLEVEREAIERSIYDLKDRSKLVIISRDDKQYLYLHAMHTAEKNIAAFLLNLTKKSSNRFKLDRDIENVSEAESIVLSDTQREAVIAAINNNLTVITGGPGTGKTTIIKCIIDILKLRKLSYVLAAPTGRAAKRITETTGENAKTIHRLLEITKVEDSDLVSQVDFQVATIDADVVIVDEASMIDTLLMNNLIKGLKADTKLIIVGDADQLPSVGPGQVLKDIIESKIAYTVFLTEIYRQSSTSDIVLMAHEVKEGKHIDFKTEDTDVFFINSVSIEDTIKKVEKLMSGTLEEKFGNSFASDIQILCPIKKTGVGVHELNKAVQKIKINPGSDTLCKKVGDRTFYVNDKVMQMINNYDINWDLNGVQGTGIYNGDIGTIRSINKVEEYLTVEYDEGKYVKYDFDELDQLDHAYAITIHKSQGSEFKTVIIPLYVCYEKLFNRNLIYTAMTRAKSLLIFVGKKQIIDYMIDNTNEKRRTTGLIYKLIGGN